jgi:hypothetical protein
VIGVELCQVKYGLICEPISLARMISQRYQEYSHDDPPDFIVRIKWTKPASNEINRGERIEKIDGFFDQGCYILSSSVYSGSINPESRYAELTFTSPMPLEDIEYFLRIVLSYGLSEKGGFLFHSAGIVRGNHAYLFFGKSGSGKTTVAQYSEMYTILSDDLVGVLPTDNGVMAFSTPFWNPGWVRHPKTQAPVAGIFKLLKSQQVSLEPIRESVAVSEILSSIPIIPLNLQFCNYLIPTIQDVISQVGVYYLNFRKDDSFWDVLVPGGKG